MCVSHRLGPRPSAARARPQRSPPSTGGSSHVSRPAQGPRIGVPQPAAISLSWRSVGVPTRIVLVAQGFHLSLTSCTCLKRNGASIPSLHQGELSQDRFDWYDVHQRLLRHRKIIRYHILNLLRIILMILNILHILKIPQFTSTTHDTHNTRHILHWDHVRR